MANLRRLTPNDLTMVRQWWRERWGGEKMIVHGEVFRPEQLEGFIAVEEGSWVGLITYFIQNNECEIMSLDSLHERQGVGTGLIHAVIETARQANCARICVNTTNDNLNALKFYQKLGFQLVTIRRNTMDEVRQLKPAVPEIGEHGIPLRDEIELELTWSTNTLAGTSPR
jgi:GNAT superfamily N-acetyltransferase